MASTMAVPSLSTASLQELRQGLDARQSSCVSLVEASLARIREKNDYYRAIIELNPDAVEIAQQLDEELVENGPRSLVSRACTVETKF